MPFAKKHKKETGFPKEGEIIEGFRAESISVRHVAVGRGRYEYPTEITDQGKGSERKARKALRRFFSTRRTVFSGYGNPYQCVPGRMRTRTSVKANSQQLLREPL